MKSNILTISEECRKATEYNKCWRYPFLHFLLFYRRRKRQKCWVHILRSQVNRVAKIGPGLMFCDPKTLNSQLKLYFILISFTHQQWICFFKERSDSDILFNNKYPVYAFYTLRINWTSNSWNTLCSAHLKYIDLEMFITYIK